MNRPLPSARPVVDRDKVIAEAIVIIEADGPGALTLTKIAKSLGVTQPALYNHVDGLDDVWRAVGLIERDLLLAHLATACMGQSGPDAVRAVSYAWRQFALGRPYLYKAVERYPVAGDPDLEDAVERVVDVLRAAVSGYGLDEEQQSHAARTLRSALHGFVDFEIDGAHPKPHEPDLTFMHLIEVFDVGFAALADGSIGAQRPDELTAELPPTD